MLAINGICSGRQIHSVLLVAGEKYETVSVDNGYSKYMMLKIRAVAVEDFGSYQCVAKNSLGETDGLIKLDGMASSFYF